MRLSNTLTGRTKQKYCIFTCSELNEVREIAERWRHEYNSERPHESVNNLTPEEFIRSLEKSPDL